MKCPPMLVPPQQSKPFKLYISADDKTIGSALVQEFEGKERVVFYLSRRLLDPKTRYSLTLSEFNLKYESTKGVKGQVMANFITQHHKPSISYAEPMP